jgi:hypothetical protein
MKAEPKVFVILLIAFASVLQGQGTRSKKDSIWLGTELQLGMPKDAVMSRLAEQYMLVRIGAGDDWLVESKVRPIVSYGEVSFANGKLSYIEKDWSSEDDGEFSFAQSLYGLLDQFGREGRQICLMSTDTSRTPEAETRSITMSCGGKKLIITTIDIFSGENRTKTAQIQEVLTTR